MPKIDFTKYELIRTWHKDGFTLRLYDTFTRGEYGKHRLAYQFKDGRTVIFEGDEFYPSPMLAIDSLATVYTLLSFLSLGEDDTDSEYFDDYTPAQLAWRDSHRREELSYLTFDWNEKHHNY